MEVDIGGRWCEGRIRPLDVFDQDSLPSDDSMNEAGDVLLVPHIAFKT